MKQTFVYFIENEHNEFYYGMKKWGIDPLKSMKFESNEDAVQYLVGRNMWMYCSVTEHEFIPQPITL